MRIIAAVDNQVLHCALSKGGTKSPALLVQLRRLFWLQHQHGFYLSTRWIGTKLNVHADEITREERAHDFRLSPRAVRLVCATMGLPSVDWCASASNAITLPSHSQPLPFVSQYACVGSAGIDVLSHHMAFMPGARSTPCPLGYAFPPVPLLPALVEHARACQAVLILIVPQSATGAWRSNAYAFCRMRMIVGAAGAESIVYGHGAHGIIGSIRLREPLLALYLDFTAYTPPPVRVSSWSVRG